MFCYVSCSKDFSAFCFRKFIYPVKSSVQLQNKSKMGSGVVVIRDVVFLGFDFVWLVVWGEMDEIAEKRWLRNYADVHFS